MRCASDGQIEEPQHSQMLKMDIDQSAEILRLRATVRDLLALSIIPEAWVARDPPAIAADLANLLADSLELDFAFVRLCDPKRCQVAEVTRGSSWQAFPEWLQQHVAEFGQFSRKEIVAKVTGDDESSCGIVIPIGVNSERGFVAAASNRSNFPDQIDQQLLSAAANNAATAFQNAFLINELRSAQEALRNNEQELRKARDELEIKVAERTAELQRSAQELQRSEFYVAEGERLGQAGSWALNPSGFFEYWSRELFQIYGLDPQKGAPTLEQYLATIHPQDRDFMAETVKRMCEQGSGCDVKKRIIRPDGAVRYIRCVGIPVLDNGVLKRFLGTAMDVTEQEQLTQDLQRREAYLAEAQRLSQTGSWAWSPDEDIRYWSEECYRFLSFDPQAGLPRFEEFFQRIHPDDQPGFRELIETAIREKGEWEADYRIVHPDGPVRDIHVLAHPVLSTSGHLVEFVGTVIDVTERKRAEEERRRSEMELRQMLDLMPQHLAVLAPDGTPLYANRVALEYLGVDMGRWRTETSRYGLLHPEDREKLLSQRQSEFLKGTPHEFEARMLRHDGIFRWFLFRLSPLKDERGDVTRWYGTGTDIEDRKQAEDRLRQENVALREEIGQASMFEDIVGTSPALKNVLSRISKVAPTDSTVLITGETGTGKELVARAIHRRSDRASRPFVGVNCAAIPRDLIASELFGHEKGAFTGASQQRLGRFELANGGTLFLDEVGELPAETQIALLRVLQEHEFERVGGTRRIRADVRVIAATNRDLEAAIRAGSFRGDLFYRLHVFPIDMPSLRERREDIPLLVEYFIDRYARKAGKNIKRVNKKTLELLQSYPWPGNIRELQNVIERSMILCETEIFSIDESWLPKQPSLTEPKNQMELPGRLLAQEKEMIEAALKESRGRIFGPKGAAAKLGIPRSTLESKIRSLKINKNRFRTSPET